MPRTRWLEPGERPDCDGILRKWKVDRAVLKPRVSATAYGTHVMTAGAVLPPDEWTALESAGCLVQAFVPEIETRGELSLVYLDGDFSHAVRKRAARGDFRVQSDFGGTVEPVAPSAEVHRFGDAVLAAVTHEWIYARVDLVEAEAGPLLMELELIEPDLFLSLPSAGRLAAALVARAGGTAA